MRVGHAEPSTSVPAAHPPANNSTDSSPPPATSTTEKSTEGLGDSAASGPRESELTGKESELLSTASELVGRELELIGQATDVAVVRAIRARGTGLNRDAHPPDELDRRARHILRAVIHEYVASGEPVASGTLAGQRGIELSSASVRSVLADLEALGYLDKPHTSAGRIPTEKGFRFYADVLVRLRPVRIRDRARIDQSYDPSKGLPPSDLRVAETSRLLHELTRYAGIATTPRHDEVIRTLEFVRLRENRVLAVMVTGSGAVRNRLLLVDSVVSQDELDAASSYLGELLQQGRTLAELRQILAAELESERALYDRLTSQALVLGARVLDATDPDMPRVVVEGETALAGEPTLSESVEQLRTLFRALEKKARLSELLARAADSGELMLFIGEETGLDAGAGLAVVASPYGRAGEILGSVGVVGPARMAYGRVIPIVEYTANALSRSLDEA